MTIHFSLFFFLPFLFFFLNCFSINLLYTQLARTKQAGRSFPRKYLLSHGSQHAWLPATTFWHPTLTLRRLSLRNAAVFRHDAVPQTGALRQLILGHLSKAVASQELLDPPTFTQTVSGIP